MIQFGQCPRCQQNIPDDRLQMSPVVCPLCGFSHSETERSSQIRIKMEFIKFISGITLGIGLLVGHLTMWNGSSLEVIPLKVKQWTGLASSADLMRLQAICVEQKRKSCVESAMVARADRGDLEAQAELGKYLVLEKRSSEARSVLSSYVKNGGLSLEAHYYLARALSETGMIDLAANEFDKVIGAKPDVLQVSVVQTYVRMLMSNGRINEALRIINDVRKSSVTASMFMNQEFQQLSQAQQ